MKAFAAVGIVAALAGSAFADDKDELCKQLKTSDEVGGAENAFMLARQWVFDCSTKIATVPPSPMAALVPWLDSSAEDPDPIVRLAFVAREANGIAMSRDDHEEEVLLPAYVIAQYDFKAFSVDKVRAALDQPPYKGNAYAKKRVEELLAAVKTDLANVDGRVKKRAADAGWKELLITAPQRGIDSWNAAAAKYKNELQHSAQFEKAAYGASLKALKGCQAMAVKDLQPILKGLKHDTEEQLIAAMSDNPVAGLLFRRYQACTAYDGNEAAATLMRKQIKGIRVIRGPRQAAAFAAIDALSKIHEDRPKFPIEGTAIHLDMSAANLDDLTVTLAHTRKSSHTDEFNVEQDSGVIKTVKPAKGVVNVTFFADVQERWVEECKNTNQIQTFEVDGTPIYKRECFNGHVEKLDVSPDPIQVPSELAAGVAAGKFVEFGAEDVHERKSFPYHVFADKKGKSLLAWYGLSLK